MEKVKSKLQKALDEVVETNVTKITLTVNGRLVPFTFVGDPSVEHMERARKSTEDIENSLRKKGK